MNTINFIPFSSEKELAILNKTIKNEDKHFQPDISAEFVGRGEVKGFKFRRLIANTRAFLYEVDSGEGQYHYEVFRVHRNKRFKNHCYPTSKSFGKWAWSYTNVYKALEKFNQLSESK